MFNVGPLELIVLAFVGLVVLGPDRLPGIARDAARMIRTLRDLATDARTQMQDELGPEFADIDLRSLNPRTAITKALLGEDADPNALKARNLVQRALLGDEDLTSLNPQTAIRQAFNDDPASTGSAASALSTANGVSVNGSAPNGAGPSGAGAGDAREVKPISRPSQPPLGRNEAVPFDPDAT
jgi:sec-independent protein translocase protein TatB